MTLSVGLHEQSDAATEAALIRLWTECGLTRPWNDPEQDIRRAAAHPSAAVLTLRDGDTLVASAMVGDDGHRGVVYYVAVDPARQGDGLGRHIMAAAEAWLAERGVPKLNLVVRDDNAAVRGFYEALGYAVEERLNLAKRLPRG
ncbi:MAG: GNAT family acetyltransferase [Pseudomonadota bacterium]